jgi:hypothetical protein
VLPTVFRRRTDRQQVTSIFERLIIQYIEMKGPHIFLFNLSQNVRATIWSILEVLTAAGDVIVEQKQSPRLIRE